MQSLVITAAETGHLVLSTLHTTGAASTIDRIIDVFTPHQQQQIKFNYPLFFRELYLSSYYRELTNLEGLQ